MAKKRRKSNRKPPEEVRQVLVKVYLEEQDHRLLKAAAAMQGLTLAGMITSLIREYLHPTFED